MKNQNSKSRNDKVSVVMATYNGASFLGEQLDSILSQTILPSEVIVMDDFSSDRTREILLTYKEQYHNIIDFKLIFRDKNVGYIDNFIDGIKSATYELVLLCDQDDVWVSNKIEKTINIFSAYDDCIAFHTETNLIDKNSIIFKEKAQGYKKELEKLNLSTFIKKVNYPGMALAFRKSRVLPKLELILERNISLPTHDWVICFLAVIQDGFYISNQVLTYRRYTGSNVALDISSGIGNAESRIKGILLYCKYYEFLDNYNSSLAMGYMLNASKRINYLKIRSIIGWLKNIRNIIYYPSLKSYIMDGIILLREK